MKQEDKDLLFKALCEYFPYKISVQLHKQKKPTCVGQPLSRYKGTLHGLLHGVHYGSGYEDDGDGGSIVFREDDHILDLRLDELKLILHPMSDLTKPIKVEGYNDGKEFVPVEHLYRVCCDGIVNPETLSKYDYKGKFSVVETGYSIEIDPID
ncbi:MAG: hypothetical protein KAS32_11820, partial [Candidatus Peribacteraceae bacterium]|nr:hypothetical protein [Candidatus Peribacteraceae bacterium]